MMWWYPALAVLGFWVLLASIEQGLWGMPILFLLGMVGWFVYGWWVKRHP